MSSPSKQRTHPLYEALTDFTLSRQAMLCSPHTLDKYQRILDRFVCYLEGEHEVARPEEVTARHVRQFLASVAPGHKDQTVHTYAACIRTLLRFWHKEGYLPQAITFDMPAIGKQRLPFLTAEQIEKLLKACDSREKALVMLMVDSGLRRQEVVCLNRSDVDMQSGAVIVRQGKGRKDRIAAIGANTRRALLAYVRAQPTQDNQAPLIQTETGQRFTAAGLRSLFVRLGKRVGFAVTPHMLRRTFATLSLKAGLDVVSLQTLMGHSNFETTRRYIQLLDDDLLQAHHQHSPVDNLRKLAHPT